MTCNLACNQQTSFRLFACGLSTAIISPHCLSCRRGIRTFWHGVVSHCTLAITRSPLTAALAPEHSQRDLASDKGSTSASGIAKSVEFPIPPPPPVGTVGPLPLRWPRNCRRCLHRVARTGRDISAASSRSSPREAASQRRGVQRRSTTDRGPHGAPGQRQPCRLLCCRCASAPRPAAGRPAAPRRSGRTTAPCSYSLPMAASRASDPSLLAWSCCSSSSPCRRASLQFL